MKSNLIITAYCIYLPVALVLTYYVANTLFKNSLIYMKDIFHGKIEIADATNTLFKIGFYLINIGFALFILRIGYTLKNAQMTIEALSYKVGGFCIYLGIMLFLNMFLFFRGKKVAREKAMVKLTEAVNK